jgi:hypothetical protein
LNSFTLGEKQVSGLPEMDFSAISRLKNDSAQVEKKLLSKEIPVSQIGIRQAVENFINFRCNK